MREIAQPLVPCLTRGWRVDIGEQRVCDRAQQGLLVLEVPVQGAGAHVQRRGQSTHREIAQTVLVEYRDRAVEDVGSAQLHSTLPVVIGF